MSETVRVGYREVPPIGKRKAYGHINTGPNEPHRWGEVEIPEYPPSPEGEVLRALRVSHDISLREAAHVLGLTAVQMSALERGAARCNWHVANAALHEYARDPKGRQG